MQSASKEKILRELRACAISEDQCSRLQNAWAVADLPEERQLWRVFRDRLSALGGEFVQVDKPEQAAQVLYSFAAERSSRQLVHSQSELVAQVLDHLEGIELHAAQNLADSNLYAEREIFGVGVSSARALVARTGSVLLESEKDGGRVLSVLADTHIVLAYVDQLVADLPQALSLVEGACSGVTTLITGPSRTADIEKVLVLGAHGPKRLVVVVIGTL